MNQLKKHRLLEMDPAKIPVCLSSMNDKSDVFAILYDNQGNGSYVEARRIAESMKTREAIAAEAQAKKPRELLRAKKKAFDAMIELCNSLDKCLAANVDYEGIEMLVNETYTKENR